MHSNIKPDGINLSISDKCCVGETGCEFDGTLRNVKSEPVFVQKVYDAILVNLQAISTVTNQVFRPKLRTSSRIVKVLNIRCKKFFNPCNIFDPCNLTVKSNTDLSGGQFLRDGKGRDIEVVGPDGVKTEKIVYADTKECDRENRGTPVFGTQTLKITGNVTIEIDVVVLDSRNRRSTVTLKANVPVGTQAKPIVLTNFFELCIPSVFDSAFFPRFAEFCNTTCETRLATNSIARDLRICPETGEVIGDLIIALCLSCEKKIIVPVQLCVLSTGFPELSPIVSPICTTFPRLFPEQIDEASTGIPCKPRPRPLLSLEDDEDSDGYDEYDED
ncbi:MAG: hypothetical protein GX329_02215 [Tissierellia bacterium]|nr:hypothetical protein [Tissierellia bacterium]